MESLFSILNSNYLHFQRHAFSAHPNGHNMFQDLDDLIRQKDNFINYIKFEYFVAILYNIMAAIPAFIYNYLKFTSIYKCDFLSTVWLIIVSSVKLLEILPKAMLLYQTIRISQSSNDPIITCRRLMYLTRSNIFVYNTILGYILLASYSLYFMFVRRTTPCIGAHQFYHIINLLVCVFFLRLIISFINYFFHFKYYNNDTSDPNEMYNEYQNRVNPDLIKKIETVELDKKNIDKYAPVTEEKEREICSICMIPFEIKDTIKILPCNKKHIFHKICIDKWLSHNKACPTCRKEITLKLIQKNKIY
jgi:hypothetical protein